MPCRAAGTHNGDGKKRSASALSQTVDQENMYSRRVVMNVTAGSSIENPEHLLVDQEDDVCSRQVRAAIHAALPLRPEKTEQVTNLRRIPIGQFTREYNRALLLRS